jgi:ATP-dependent DNA helicase PIF1
MRFDRFLQQKGRTDAPVLPRVVDQPVATDRADLNGGSVCVAPEPSMDAGGGAASAAVRPPAAAPDVPTGLTVPPSVRDPLFSVLCGGAGCGKTTLAREWAGTDPSVTLCATTGIASLNLGEGVTTINALLKFFDTASLVQSYTTGGLAARLRSLRRSGLQRIVLDEMSMLDGDQLTVLVRALDEVNGEDSQYVLDAQAAEDDKDLEPMGLTLVGDFCQLPPVKAPFAFESSEWERFQPHVTTLTHIHRQADPAFVQALRACRRGDARSAVTVLRGQLTGAVDLSFDGPTIVATNEAVERINGLRLDKLKTTADTYVSSRWGEQRPEWKKNIPEAFAVKPGALVMVLANKWIAEDEYYQYVNGDLGIYEGKAASGGARVTLQRGGEEVVVNMIVREITEPLEVGERKQLKAEGLADRIKDRKKITGAITYLPLRVAYSTTVHKSQGLSLDRAQLVLREHFFSHPGMLYVALSRARTVEGLRIVGTEQGLISRCTTDTRVQEWL